MLSMKASFRVGVRGREWRGRGICGSIRQWSGWTLPFPSETMSLGQEILACSHPSTPGEGELEYDRCALKALPSRGSGGRHFLSYLSVGNEVSLCRFEIVQPFPFLGLSWPPDAFILCSHQVPDAPSLTEVTFGIIQSSHGTCQPGTGVM